MKIVYLLAPFGRSFENCQTVGDCIRAGELSNRVHLKTHTVGTSYENEKLVLFA